MWQVSFLFGLPHLLRSYGWLSDLSVMYCDLQQPLNWVFFMLFCRLLFFFRKKIFLQEYHQSVKQYGSRSDPTFCRIWAGSNCLQRLSIVGKGYKKSNEARKDNSARLHVFRALEIRNYDINNTWYYPTETLVEQQTLGSYISTARHIRIETFSVYIAKGHVTYFDSLLKSQSMLIGNLSSF